MSLKSRITLTVAAVAGVILGSLALAGPASASAGGVEIGSEVYGSKFETSFDASGKGLYLNFVRITAEAYDPSTENPQLDFPRFVGCNAHVQLYRSGGGFNIDTAALPCSTFVAEGASEVINIYANVPAGKYCTRIWVDNLGAGYASGARPCFQVKGKPRP